MYFEGRAVKQAVDCTIFNPVSELPLAFSMILLYCVLQVTILCDTEHTVFVSTACLTSSYSLIG